MQKIPWKKGLAPAVYLLLALMIGLAGYFGLTRRANRPTLTSLVDKKASRPSGAVLQPCVLPTDQLCLLSLGTDAEGNLLVTLRTTLSPSPVMYANLVSEGQNVVMQCQAVEVSPQIVYCLGPVTDVPEALLGIYAQEDGSLLAAGEITLSDGSLALPVPVPTEPLLAPPPTPVPIFPTETPIPILPIPATLPAYPSYPSYPTYP